MKIKRFQAKTMREAMRLVREEQGPDAVILSNRRVADGIEVVAAVDYDAALMQQALRKPAEPEAMIEEAIPEPPPAPRARQAANPTANQAAQPAPRPQMPSMNFGTAGGMSVTTTFKMAAPAPEPIIAAPQASQLHVPQLHAPVRAPAASPVGAAFTALTDMGIAPDLAQAITAELPRDTGADRARFLPLGLLSKRLPMAKTDEILEGGVHALIGPTGVGKTTTLAKLAAHYIRKHGAHGVALICTDHYRIGALEQLSTYGKLLGVPVHNAPDARTLGQVLAHLKDCKLILIDTAGISQRDHKLAEQFITLSSQRVPVKCWLTLSANAQPEALEEAVRKFGTIRCTGCILTKLDETARIGGALSVAIRQKLPIAYTTDGQRVPEDLQFARAERLVIKAMQLARASAPPPSTSTASFAGVLHAAG